MTTRQHFNNSSFTLASDLSDVSTSITLNSNIPTITSDAVRYTIYSGSNVEIISIASNAGAPTYTCTRALEGTTAIAWSSGTAVECRGTADSFDRKEDLISGRTLTAATIATDDKILIQDTSNSDNLKTVLVSDVAGLGAVSFIGVQTASASPQLDFTGLSNYSKVVFVLNEIAPATDNVELRFRTSTDNGSTFDSGASDYRYAARSATTVPSATQNGSTATAYISLGDAQVGNAANEFAAGEVTLINPTSAAWKHVLYNITYQSALTAFLWYQGASVRATAADVDAVRFYFSSGNIASGSIYAYGYKKS